MDENLAVSNIQIFLNLSLQLFSSRVQISLFLLAAFPFFTEELIPVQINVLSAYSGCKCEIP